MIAIGNAKRIVTILFAILAFAGIIGLVIACLNVIPNGKGGTALEEVINNLNKPEETTPIPNVDQTTPAGNNTTTTPSGSNDETPDKVDPQGGRVWVYNSTKDKYELSSYSYEYEEYPVTIGDTVKTGWRGPILKIKVDNPNLLYKVTFDVSDAATGDNAVSYYNPSNEKWVAHGFMKSGTIYGVEPDSDGYIYLILCDNDYLSSDLSYYEGKAERMEEYGFIVEVGYDSTVVG